MPQPQVSLRLLTALKPHFDSPKELIKFALPSIPAFDILNKLSDLDTPIAIHVRGVTGRPRGQGNPEYEDQGDPNL